MAAEGIVRIQMLPSAAGLGRALHGLANDLGTKRGQAIERAVDEVIRPAIGANFTTRGGATGPPDWADWSEATPLMPYHRFYGPASGILEVTGTLRSEATTKKIWGFQGTQGTAVAYGHRFVRAPYALFMQNGTNINNALGYHQPVPARPFIRINDADMEHISDIFKDWFGRKAGAYLAKAI